MKTLLCIIAILFSVPVYGTVELAPIYLPFEGTNGANSTNNPAVANMGTTFEKPSYVGTSGGVPTFASQGIKGNAADFSLASMGGSFSTYRYGQASGTNNTAWENTFINATSLTITGWFKTNPSATIGANAKIITFGPWSITCMPTNDGRISLHNSSGNASISQSTAIYGNQNQWVFFAITYDATSTTDNLKYYVGTESAPVQFGVSRSVSWGNLVGDSTGAITYLANNQVSPGSRSFQGLLDEIRVYSSHSDSSGALPAQAIEEIRMYDVPEPTTLLLFGMAGFWLRKQNI